MSSPYELGKPWLFSVIIKISEVLLKNFNKSSICWQGVNDEIIPTLFIIFSLTILNLNNLIAFPEFYQNPLYVLLLALVFNSWANLLPATIYEKSYSIYFIDLIQFTLVVSLNLIHIVPDSNFLSINGGTKINLTAWCLYP